MAQEVNPILNGIINGAAHLARGFVSIFDLFGVHHPPIQYGSFEDDAKALAGDWRAVGNDMRIAMARYERETEESRNVAAPTKAKSSRSSRR